MNGSKRSVIKSLAKNFDAKRHKGRVPDTWPHHGLAIYSSPEGLFRLDRILFFSADARDKVEVSSL